MTTLRVSEIFYAPQGEGGRVGEASVFVRLQGCSAKHACFQSGVVCDTEFESGKAMTLAELQAAVQKTALHPESESDRPTHSTMAGDWIIWTGGEPLDQLTPEIVEHFRTLGYRQAIETSGVRPFPAAFRTLFDWVTCSPKVAEHVLEKHFGDALIHVAVPATKQPELMDGSPNTNRVPVSLHVHELRYVRHTGQDVPQPKLKALHYFLSPHSDGFTINQQNVQHVLGLTARHPRWRISVQQHKAWKTL